MDLSVEMKKKTAPALAAGKAGAGPVEVPRPDPEVVAKPRRRAFTAEYKRRILNEADAARFSG